MFSRKGSRASGRLSRSRADGGGEIKKSRLKKWRDGALKLAFLGCFGFTGGVLFLLFVLVPFEQWLKDSAVPQGRIDLLMGALTLSWVLISLLATKLYAFLFFSRRRDLPAGVAVLAATGALSFVTFFVLLDADLMAALGEVGQQTTEGERFTFGPYPDAEKVEELEEQGYDGIITILNPDIPFERVLLERERTSAEEAGIELHSHPMLPWISQNNRALEEISALVDSDPEKRYYVHCYLGKHRVDYVRQQLLAATGEDESPELEPLPERFERGRVLTFADEQVILGPYPTEEEWFNFVVRREVEEVVSTLDPDNPEDAPWIEEESRLAEENGLAFKLMPLDPESPDPTAAREIARYALESEGKVYVHDFLQSERFEVLEKELNAASAPEEPDPDRG